MINIFVATSKVVYWDDSVAKPLPVYWIHNINANDVTALADTNARLPAILFLGLYGQGFLDPYRRPTISAIPSPAAKVDMAIIPCGDSVQKATIDIANIQTYINGPPRASLLFPERLTAWANADSDMSGWSLPLSWAGLWDAMNNRIPFNMGTMAAKTRDDGWWCSKSGQNSMNNGADKVCIILRASRDTRYCFVTVRYVMTWTKAYPNNPVKRVVPTSRPNTEPCSIGRLLLLVIVLLLPASIVA